MLKPVDPGHPEPPPRAPPQGGSPGRMRVHRKGDALPGYDEWLTHRDEGGGWDSPERKEASYTIRDGGALNIVEKKPVLSAQEQAEMKLKLKKQKAAEKKRELEEKQQLKTNLSKKTKEEVAVEAGLDKIPWPSIPNTEWSLPPAPPLPDVRMEDEVGKNWVVIEECRAGQGGIVMSRVMKQLHPSSAGREALA